MRFWDRWPVVIVVVVLVCGGCFVVNRHFHVLGQLAKVAGRNYEGQDPVEYVWCDGDHCVSTGSRVP